MEAAPICHPHPLNLSTISDHTHCIALITMHLLALLLSHLEREKKKTGEEKLSLLKQALIHPPAHTAKGGN